ncbi:MAG: hypothetical protein HOH46_16565, partial [Rhodospirillaceae bacterium]|nr:hypothetical protein [Rhodospirillaceae bacterium]
FDLNRCKSKLLDYVKSAQPGLVKLLSRQLSSIVEGDQKANSLQLAEILVTFTYDVIERSRRRSIQEAILLARNANADDEIRKRLLDYLQEGVGAESLDILLEQTEVRMEPWRQMLDKIDTPFDAGEVRGLAIRALESYPDHPGVLLLRSVSEMMCSDANDVTASQTIHAALRSSKERYGLTDEDIIETLSWLGDLADTRTTALRLPMAVAFYQAKAEGLLSKSVTSHGVSLLKSLDDENVDAARHVAFLSEATDGLETATGLVRRVVSDINLSKVIGRAS